MIIVSGMIKKVFDFLMKKNKKKAPGIKKRESPFEAYNQWKKERLAIPKDSPDLPVPFGFKCCWFVVKSDNLEKVLQSLNLSNTQANNWFHGIENAYRFHKKKVFISPPIKGWIYVVAASSLPRIETEKGMSLLIQLSRDFGEAHYYGTLDSVDYYGWGKAIAGELIRGYAHCEGEELLDSGDQTEEEIQVLNKRKEIWVKERDPSTGEVIKVLRKLGIGEEQVMELAGLWSINPQTLEDYKERGLGIIGELPLQYLKEKSL